MYKKHGIHLSSVLRVSLVYYLSHTITRCPLSEELHPAVEEQGPVSIPQGLTYQRLGYL